MYGHMSTSELEALRDKLQTAWEDSLTKPQVSASSGRRAEYQRSPADIKAALEGVIAELAIRAGTCAPRGPIYMVG